MFVEIYGRLSCPYCVRAKALAEKMKNELNGFDFKFVDMVAEGISKEDLALELVSLLLPYLKFLSITLT